MIRLIQIPFSHNCVKVRRALDLKGLAYETEDIAPVDRASVRRASGQALVPVLVDGQHTVSDSTAILLYLEGAYPDPPLLPEDPGLRAECLVLEDWADAALMELTRRLAYWSVLSTPGRLEDMFFPGQRGLRRRLQGRLARRIVRRRFGISASRNLRDEVDARRVAALAVHRLGGRPFLVGERVTLADATLAAMSQPLRAAAPGVRDDPAVATLLAWGRGILGEEAVADGASRLPRATPG
ncbi:MAG: glutathione S-transferase family protein [Gemmatimonadota bacterium]